MTSASLRVAPQGGGAVVEERVAVRGGDLAARFTPRLEAGPAHVTTEFAGADGLSLGAYYVYVRLTTGEAHA